MNLASRGYATDLMIASMEGSVVHGDGYVAALTPSCPAFWWGNFILFSEPPERGRERHWEETFDRELAGVSGVEHRLFAWDRIDGEVGGTAGFVERGYALRECIFLMTRSVQRSSRHRTDVVVRLIEDDVDWKRALSIQHESLDRERDTESFRRFQASQMARNQRMVGRGYGKWFGAFDGANCVATMGIFVRDGVARCQSVATLPEYRRKGYCSTLVHGACEHAFREMGAREIVIMTDVGNPAAQVYMAVGFRIEERVASLSRSRATGELPLPR
jgi:RimJ/RimL family protein N-acetyltransferase